MGLHRFRPLPSGRMGMLWTLASIENAAIIEFGCMGHMMYSGVTLENAGVRTGALRFSSHIDETDIALGGTDRLAATLAQVIGRHNPRAVFLLPSSIPQVIGTDLAAEASELQRLYPHVPLIPFGQGGFDVDQHRGVQEALLQLVKVLPKEVEKSPEPSFNIIGSCADLFRFQADAAEIIRIMEGAFSMKPACVLTSSTSVEAIEGMGCAQLNLVIRREGELAAAHLRERLGIPYLVGRPYGVQGTLRWLEEISQMLGIVPDEAFVAAERREGEMICRGLSPLLRHMMPSRSNDMCLNVGGHGDVVRGIVDFGCGELGLPKGDCWCDSPQMQNNDIPYWDESQWSKTAQTTGLLMASGELLSWANRDRALQIANPDVQRRINPYVPPFVGFRGALHLTDLWVNAIVGQGEI